MERLEKILSTKKTRIIVGILGVLLVFHAGVVVGSHHGERGRMHGFRPAFFPGDFELPHGFLQDGHGAIGIITAMTPPTILMETRGGMSQTILTSTSTRIWNREAPAATTTLSLGETVVVLGSPDDQGRINARIITILPAVPPLP